MSKLLLGISSLIVVLFSISLYAAQGEWWELTVKMEMEGMPFAMPAQTSKICMPKGGQSDPSNTQSKDSNCKMTDVKHSGNTVKFKGACVDKGETMNISGETTHDANSLKSNVKMSGKSRGENMNMAMSSSGKRVGGSCDTEEMNKKVQGMIKKSDEQNREMKAQMCNTSKFKTKEWAASAHLFVGKGAICSDKKEEMCKVLRKEVPRDVEAFQMLSAKDKNSKDVSVSQVCNLDMEGIKKSLCKTQANRGPLRFLEANCPAEAKTYRELLRKREACEERGYTSGSKMKQCMGGQMIEENTQSVAPVKSRKASADAKAGGTSSGDSNSEAVREGTKALKGLLGF